MRSPKALIRELVRGVATGRSADFLSDMMETALQLGRDHASIADLKLISRSMREIRNAAAIFQQYTGIRKVAVFGSARTPSEDPDFQLAREFARRIVEENFMIITGGGNGIMGAAQQGAGAEKSFGLNIRLPFEQGANATIEGDPKLVQKFSLLLQAELLGTGYSITDYDNADAVLKGELKYESSTTDYGILAIHQQLSRENHRRPISRQGTAGAGALPE